MAGRRVKTYRAAADCPPELYACELCGKLNCQIEDWGNCRSRLGGELPDGEAYVSEIRQKEDDH